MKLDRRHLIGSLVLMAAAIAYNVYSFMPASSGPRGPQTGVVGQAAAGVDAPAASRNSSRRIDPADVQPLTDVQLDRLPQWGRDPFTDPNPPPVVEEVVAEAPEREPDPVVSTIMYSADVRRALVGGRAVRVGDSVGNFLVVDILPRAVVFRDRNGEQRTVELRRGGL